MRPKHSSGASGRWGPPARGAPPADEAVARQEIADAFAAMTAVDETSGSIPAVEGSTNLGACVTEARVRLPGPPEANITTAFTIDRLRFLNDHEAMVSYTLTIAGGFNTTLGNRAGRAVLVEGQWKVTRQTFCELMALAGVTCPP